MPKTLDEIRQEYSNLCSKAGHINYQIYTLKREVEMINELLKDLNMEANKLSNELDANKISAEMKETKEKLNE